MNGDIRGCKIRNFKPLRKNTLQGVFDLELPFAGIILRGCTFHERDGKSWVGWPAQSYVKQDGTKSWTNIVDFVDNNAKYLVQAEVLPRVLAAMAEAALC
jgi:hypothetical protein